MNGQAEETGELTARVAGQELAIKGVSINTIATVATLMLVTVLGVLYYYHGADTREASKELVGALKEMTQAAREQNCLISMPQDRREQNAEICKRISR